MLGRGGNLTLIQPGKTAGLGQAALLAAVDGCLEVSARQGGWVRVNPLGCWWPQWVHGQQPLQRKMQKVRSSALPPC